MSQQVGRGLLNMVEIRQVQWQKGKQALSDAGIAQLFNRLTGFGSATAGQDDLTAIGGQVLRCRAAKSAIGTGHKCRATGKVGNGVRRESLF